MDDFAHASDVELLVLDVDGVLTDGSIALDDRGVETKRFHVRDGTGIRLWQRLGYEVAVITGRQGMAVSHRLGELGVQHIFQGVAEKARLLLQLCEQIDIPPRRTAVLGDDLPDLSMLELVGYPMAVSDAVAEVRDAAAHVTIRPGGHGAVREAIEHLIKAKERWPDALNLYGYDHDAET